MGDKISQLDVASLHNRHLLLNACESSVWRGMRRCIYDCVNDEFIRPTTRSCLSAYEAYRVSLADKADVSALGRDSGQDNPIQIIGRPIPMMAERHHAKGH